MLTGLGDLVAVLAHNGEVQQRVEVGDDARGHGVSQAVVLGVDQSDLGAHALKEGEGAGVHRTGSAIGHEEDVGLTLGGNLERAVEVLAGVVGGGVDPLHLGEQEGGVRVSHFLGGTRGHEVNHLVVLEVLSELLGELLAGLSSVLAEIEDVGEAGDHVVVLVIALGLLKDLESKSDELHPHNDRGCGVAAAELGLLAGADRIEGTLFGNGERTGNVDIITLAMNMFSHGIDPKLNFSNMSSLVEVYERVTGMRVHERQPYAGKLVFTAFSGSHQDAIAKGMAWREAGKSEKWDVPYLPIDPKDVGRTYDSDVIRINSQSGKGGVCYVLRTNFGLSLPENMREEVGYTVKDISDKAHKELTPAIIYQIFEDHYVTSKSIFQVSECHFRQENGIVANATIQHGQNTQVVTGTGNGRLDAVSNAIKNYFNVSYELSFYEEHSLTKGSSSKAVAYVGVVCNGRRYWGVGIDNDIIKASIEALTVAVNKIEEIQNAQFAKDKRMVEIMNYIQSNYLSVTLEGLSDKFYLSKPYLSKYIKEKSGMTFGELVKNVRLKKAKTLLKTSSMTVESIALSVGYQNVEHFNRLFKKAFNMTPVQFRNKK